MEGHQGRATAQANRAVQYELEDEDEEWLQAQRRRKVGQAAAVGREQMAGGAGC